VAPKKNLPPKRALFVKEYLVNFNGKQAAIRAGYSPRTAEATASRLLTFVNVQAAIQEENQKRFERLEIKADEVLGEMAKLAFSDIRKLFDENGNLIPVHLLDDDTAATIADVTVSEIDGGEDKPPSRLWKIKQWDKLKALELLGKHLALFTDRVVAKVEFDIDVILRDLSSSTRGLPSMMQCNLKAVSGDDDQQG